MMIHTSVYGWPGWINRWTCIEIDSKIAKGLKINDGINDMYYNDLR